MKILSNKAHGVLDFVTVIIFAVLPTLFGFSGMPAYLSYALAVIHLLMTLLTNFPFGVVKVIPLGFHKMVEMIVGPALVVVPWILGFADNLTARYVYVAMGVIIIAVGQLSKYERSLG